MRVLPVHHLGHERVPLQLIDDAFPDLARLRDAGLAADYQDDDQDLYPGRRAPAPSWYLDWLGDAVGSLHPGKRVQALRASFAIVTKAPRELAPIQRIPHFDTPDARVFAAVHYLCTPPHGGTKFYRHRRSGFETIDPARLARWPQLLRADAASGGMPDFAYIDGDTPLYECIGEAALAMNRIALYPANALHSGQIGHSWSFSSMAGARLTITTILEIE